MNNNKHKCKDKFKIIKNNNIKIKQADIELLKIINENSLITPSVIKEKCTEKEITLNDQQLIIIYKRLGNISKHNFYDFYYYDGISR